MYKQTIAFITKGDLLLMLNRNKAPNQGLWNGVGGKMEAGESPDECIVREVKEETGLPVDQMHFINKGSVRWEIDEKRFGGMYVYHVKLQGTYALQTPSANVEGILDWKDQSWVLDEQNQGVGGMIPRYLPQVLKGVEPCDHHFIMQDQRIARYECQPLSVAKNFKI
ncbi:NUDIX hydrolase [Halobacillus amylolyticus]|uniref:8-oxo-dGTP diphosphatase n=1 Tax=Halobacillus amylolyticus TaxID=2932259 RepID=A0ABY4H9R0_9BACI|nr:8-oxo-dGTP diphosphatase [Halobacillus amylolyticus]UOR11028.1 8-oxo-dGTP diphosphatase [Halobacillus amylolyticus]